MDTHTPRALPLVARARHLGGRIEVREVPEHPSVATAPLTFAGTDGGYFVVLRFGALVSVGTTPEEDAHFLEIVKPLVVDPQATTAEEAVDLVIDSGGREGVLPDGEVQLHDLDVERAQVVAHVLAKSALLTYYEERVASVFDRVEALAAQLRDTTVPASGRDLVREIGEVLLIRTRMVGRVEVSEKPEITWEDPDLDRLYGQLATEFELRDRDRALSRKLELISDVAGTYLELLDTRKSLRLEWYIVVLILVEIVLFVWEIFFR